MLERGHLVLLLVLVLVLVVVLLAEERCARGSGGMLRRARQGRRREGRVLRATESPQVQLFGRRAGPGAPLEQGAAPERSPADGPTPQRPRQPGHQGPVNPAPVPPKETLQPS